MENKAQGRPTDPFWEKSSKRSFLKSNFENGE